MQIFSTAANSIYDQLQRFDQASQQIAQSDISSSVSVYADQRVEQISAQRQVEASSKSLSAANQMIGSLLDIRV